MTTGGSALRSSGSPRPPYLPFLTLIVALDEVEERLPGRVRPTTWGTHPKATQSQLTNALRFLGGIDDQGNVLPPLQRICLSRGDERRAAMRAVLDGAYSPILELAAVNASPTQFYDALGRLGLSGNTARKGGAFFLKAADWAGLPLPQEWMQLVKRGPQSTDEDIVIDDASDDELTPSIEPTPFDALRARYVETLIQRVAETFDPQDDTALFDRIEGLLGLTWRQQPDSPR